MGKRKLAILIVVVLVISVVGLVYEFKTPAKAFTLKVFPDSVRGDAIAGQRVVFLVTVSSNDTNPLSDVRISATAHQSAVTVTPETLSPGEVGEVAVIPDVTAVGTNVTLAVRAEGEGAVQTRSVSFSVLSGEDWRLDHARELREFFVQWLQTNASSLGITNQTQWMGTIVSPRWLIVEHYLFFSNAWEMHVYWHVMIPPSDWARIDLRQRSTGFAPSLSYEISSVNGSTTPHPIPSPDQTWR
jgi:hypothetical protein